MSMPETCNSAINQAILHARFPSVAKAVQQAEGGGDFQFFHAKNGMLNAKLQDKPLYSVYDPVRSVTRQLQDVINRPLGVVVYAGFGLGYELISAVQLNPVERHVVVLFDLGAFKQVLEQVDLARLLRSESVKLVLPENFETWIQDSGHLVQNGFRIVTNPTYQHEYGTQIQGIKKQLLRIFNQKNAAAISSVTNDARFMTNLLLNMPQWRHRIGQWGEFRNQCKDRAAVCASAGPSLTQNLPFLKDTKSRSTLVLVATDTATPVLMAHQIKPDFIVSADPGLGNTRHFEPCWAQLGDIPLIADPMLNPHLVRRYPGPIYFYPISHPAINLFYGECETDFLRGTSVGAISVSFAHFLGCRTIGLLGLDLSFPNLESYASGTAKKTARFQVDDQGRPFKEILDVGGHLQKTYLKKVASNNGGSVYTDETLFPFLLDVEGLIASCPAHYANFSEAGAVISGAPFKGIEKFLKWVGDASPPHWVLPKIENASQTQNLLDLTSQVVADLSVQHDVANQAYAALQNPPQPLTQDWQAKMNDFNEVVRRPKAVFDLVEQLLSATYRGISQALSDTLIAKNRRFFEGVLTATTQLIHLLEVVGELGGDELGTLPDGCPYCQSRAVFPMETFADRTWAVKPVDYAQLWRQSIVYCEGCGLIYRYPEQPLKPSVTVKLKKKDPVKIDQKWTDYVQAQNPKGGLDLGQMLGSNPQQFIKSLQTLSSGQGVYFYMPDCLANAEHMFEEVFPFDQNVYLSAQTVSVFCQAMGLKLDHVASFEGYVFVSASVDSTTKASPVSYSDYADKFRTWKEIQKLADQAYLYVKAGDKQTAKNFMGYAIKRGYKHAWLTKISERFAL